MALRYRSYLPLAVFFLIAAAAAVVCVKVWQKSDRKSNSQHEDIYYSYLEGSRLIQGENPYARILAGDMRQNQKYATYLPLFYLLSGGSQLVGLREFPVWLSAWRVIFLLCALGIGYLVFHACCVQGMPMLGLFGAAFWFFNRWTLHVIFISHLDFSALFFLLLSLHFIPRKMSVACLLFGLSLAIKQFAVFAWPLFLVWAWQSGVEGRRKRIIKTAVLSVAVPAVVSIPFLVWNMEGFIKSMLFSATRLPDSHFGAPSLDAMFGCHGVLARLPVMILIVAVYALAWTRRWAVYVPLFLIMTLIPSFSPVFFRQYMVWSLPFVPLAALEIWDKHGKRNTGQ